MTEPIIRIAKPEDADEICRLYSQLSNSSDICVLPEKIKDFKKTLNNTSKNLYKRIHKKIDVEELFRSIIEEKRI